MKDKKSIEEGANSEGVKGDQAYAEDLASRINLVLKAITVESSPPSTLVFYEVATGHSPSGLPKEATNTKELANSEGVKGAQALAEALSSGHSPSGLPKEATNTKELADTDVVLTSEDNLDLELGLGRNPEETSATEKLEQKTDKTGVAIFSAAWFCIIALAAANTAITSSISSLIYVAAKPEKGMTTDQAAAQFAAITTVGSVILTAVLGCCFAPCVLASKESDNKPMSPLANIALSAAHASASALIGFSVLGSSAISAADLGLFNAGGAATTTIVALACSNGRKQ
jgi:hypothetical protein